MELPRQRKMLLALLAVTLTLGSAFTGCQKAADPSTTGSKPGAQSDNSVNAAPQDTTPASPVDASTPSAEQPSPEGGEAAKPDAQVTPDGEESLMPSSGAAPEVEEASDASADAPEPTAADDPSVPRDLGPPLVDDPTKLAQLLPDSPAWFDKTTKSVVLVGEVCQRKMSLELFACLKNSKEHESIVSVPTQAYIVHAGLLAAGAEPGNPVQFYPEYVAASGPEIEITVIWKDSGGEIRRARAQDWVRHIETKKPLEYPWVFCGSHFVKDEQSGRPYYRADGEGDLICVSNFPSAVLDLPVKSTDQNASLLFECFTERIPPVGTPVTLVLTPKRVTESK